MGVPPCNVGIIVLYRLPMKSAIHKPSRIRRVAIAAIAARNAVGSDMQLYVYTRAMKKNEGHERGRLRYVVRTLVILFHAVTNACSSAREFSAKRSTCVAKTEFFGHSEDITSFTDA